MCFDSICFFLNVHIEVNQYILEVINIIQIKWTKIILIRPINMCTSHVNYVNYKIKIIFILLPDFKISNSLNT